MLSSYFELKITKKLLNDKHVLPMRFINQLSAASDIKIL